MVFAKISDLKKTVEAVVFPRIFSQTADLWKIDNVILLSGKLELKISQDVDESSLEDTTEATIIVDSAAAFTGPDTHLPPPVAAYTRTPPAPAPDPDITIDIPPDFSSARLVSLNNLLSRHRGHQPARLRFIKSTGSKILNLPYGLNWTPELEKQLSALLKNS